jgi:hypothetical protein
VLKPVALDGFALLAVSLTHVSDSGSETGAVSRPHVRSDAVSIATRNALTSVYIPHQVRYSDVRVVRDEEAAAGEE